MTDKSIPIIYLENIGKMYHLYNKPIDRLKHSLFWRFGKSYGKEFWALKDVTLDINKGDAVGVLGRNGSGKSTLLQLIAGVLSPSRGELKTNGRISALLELGSGFNIEYTGRENIFLSGAILGFGTDEMQEKAEEIISFADIGDFIDQPVKTYSSGMFARLAFSVAVSIEPDILIVDEILSVGDFGFQQKCISKMRKMRDNGLTLLYVSHNPNSIKDICNKALFLNKGETIFWGNAEDASNLYLKHLREIANFEAIQVQPKIFEPDKDIEDKKGKLRYGTGDVYIKDVTVLNSENEICNAFSLGEEIKIKINYHSRIDIDNLNISFLVRDMSGIDLMGTTTFDENIKLPSVKKDKDYSIVFRFENCLRSGNFGISAAINRVTLKDYSDVILFDQIDACATFLILASIDRPVHYKFFTPVDITFSK